MSMDGLQSAPAGTNVGAPTNGPADGTSADAAGDGTSADAAGDGTSADAAVGTSTGTSADAARDLQLLSAKELWEFWVKCVKLKDEIVDRNHKGRQGRRAADDTARWNFIDRCVLPSLKRGKLPSE